MREFPTLYKKTARGVVNQWTVFQDSDRYWTEFGMVGGTIQKSDDVYCTPKNVGRSNETTAEQQSMLEAESAWRKKIEREGFVADIFQAERGGVFNPPMLAKVYDGVYTDEMRFIQPKLDGIRCNMSLNGGRVMSVSRRNMPFSTTGHIEQELEEFFRMHPDVHLDGELYNHELHDDFSKIVSLVKKKRLTEEDEYELKDKLKYYVYDLWVDGEEDMQFSYRSRIIRESLSDIACVEVVPTYEVSSSEDVDRFFEQFLNEGFEGAIIRSDKPYEHKRSKNLLKYKRFLDDEFEIVSVNIGKNNTIAESLTIILGNGERCNATLAFTDDECGRILANRDDYIGKKATVSYFGVTKDGMLRFPVVKDIDRDSHE